MTFLKVVFVIGLFRMIEETTTYISERKDNACDKCTNYNEAGKLARHKRSIKKPFKKALVDYVLSLRDLSR